MGRRWLAQDVRDELYGDEAETKTEPSRNARGGHAPFLIIFGESGTGKSAFLGRILEPTFCTDAGGPWEQLNRHVLARHICQVQDAESLDALRWARSLAADWARGCARGCDQGFGARTCRQGLSPRAVTKRCGPGAVGHELGARAVAKCWGPGTGCRAGIGDRGPGPGDRCPGEPGSGAHLFCPGGRGPSFCACRESQN